MNKGANISLKIEVDLQDDEWLNSYSEKAGTEFYKTLWKEREYDVSTYIDDDYFINQLDTNPRLAKICNSTLRSCINYVRFKYLDNVGLKKIWTVNSNICGHKGRVKNFETNSIFKIGDSDIRFPGETFNLNCDCEIGTDGIKLLI